MPPVKRSHGRITSGHLRPHKTARFGHESGEQDGSSANDGLDVDILMGEEPSVSATPTYTSLNSQFSEQYTNMKAAEVIAWPTSLAVVRHQLQYNLTPQEGPLLPDHILRLVSSRILRPSLQDGLNAAPPSLPYLHLGFTPFLDLQIFVFVPNLRLSADYTHTNRLSNANLERWTDTIFLPSIRSHDPRTPSSWRLSNLYKYSPAWFDEETAPYPVYKIHDSEGGQLFSRIWQRMLDLSMKTREFQHPFLLLYSNGESPQMFCGDSPEQMIQDFETAWLKHVDMAYIPSPQDDLRITFTYDDLLDTKDLPMR